MNETTSKMPTDEDAGLIRGIRGRLKVQLDEIPYTAAFEVAFAEFTATSATRVDRHGFWKLLHTTGDSLPAAAASLPVASAPILMTKLATGDPPRVEGLPLFANQLPATGSLSPYQPWKAIPPALVLDPVARERERLLAAIGHSELASVEIRVGYILSRFPETRDSDVALALRYWSTFEATVIEAWDHQDLTVLFDLQAMSTLARARAHIQNDLSLFVGSEYLKKMRAERQATISEYLAAHRATAPEILFYLDETGDNGKLYIGVAGVCLMNYRQYEKHAAAIRQWREQQQWVETIHFAEINDARGQQRAVALLTELNRRKTGLLFVGYTLPSRGQMHQALASLFLQLILDSLRHMRETGCLTEPRMLTVIKEAEPGFDGLYLQQVKENLQDQLLKEFPEHVALREVKAVSKGREVFLECADLVAGGMQRRAALKGIHPKDLLSEAVFNVTGFEDPQDKGVVFRAYR